MSSINLQISTSDVDKLLLRIKLIKFRFKEYEANNILVHGYFKSIIDYVINDLESIVSSMNNLSKVTMKEHTIDFTYTESMQNLLDMTSEQAKMSCKEFDDAASYTQFIRDNIP